MPFISPIYQIPFGIELGQVPASRFTGSPVSGLLEGVNHSVFFSPSFISALSGNEIDIDTIEVTARATDVYSFPATNNANDRVFTWGPNSPLTYKSTVNTSIFVTTPKTYTAIGTMVPPLPGTTGVYKIL
jgi:hypothetical protein